jgi:sulfite reductase (NADPH) flavoprotein alpha-component
MSPSTAGSGLRERAGNGLAMLALAVAGGFMASWQGGDWWVATPATGRWAAAGVALLAYVGLTAGWLWFAHRRDRAMSPGDAVSHDATWVVHASQTGFALELADLTAASLRTAGMPVQRAALEHLDGERLAAIRQALFVVSTTGEGDPPDPALGFVRSVMGKSATLANLRYAVLALGDREYQHFCAFGHQLDDWLRRHAAQPLFDLVEVDNADDGALRHWQHHLGQISGGTDLPDWDAPRYATWTLVERLELNPGSIGGSAFHLALAPPSGTAPDWTAGDIVEIGPRHARADVDAFLASRGLPPEARVTWQDETFTLADVIARSQWASATLISADTTPQSLADAALPLPHREYSIASIPTNGTLQLLVRLMTRDDGSPGLGSGWLCRHAALGDGIALRIRRNPNFHAPSANVPMILIGNGTGLAGLRAHLRARSHAGAHRNWLLFGERQRAHDYFHRDELERWHADGHLERLDLVFSRDSDPHRYVQHALRAHAETLREWIGVGATLYVCGSLEGMAPGVDQVLRDMLGDAQVEDLLAAGRYRRDVY